MKLEYEILDDFGKLIISKVFDDNLKYQKDIVFNKVKWGKDKQFTEVFEKLENKDKVKIVNMFAKSIQTSIFSFISIFEENEQFKIVYEENGTQVDLVKISEMLKAEPLGEDGWIARFGKELDKDEIC